MNPFQQHVDKRLTRVRWERNGEPGGSFSFGTMGKPFKQHLRPVPFSLCWLLGSACLHKRHDDFFKIH